jgi:hypothetical protein
MTVKTTVSKSDFRDAFNDFGRGDQFSHEGLGLLYDFMEEIEQDIGEEWELDVIALCCDFSEEPWESIADNYSIDTSDCEDENDAIQEVEEYLLENTMLVGQTNAGDFIYQAF